MEELKFQTKSENYIFKEKYYFLVDLHMESVRLFRIVKCMHSAFL